MIPTGYKAYFIFEFESDDGTQNVIKIWKKGYTGSSSARALGRAPLLRRENGERGVLGTSLEIFAQCDIDAEFAELYTTDAREFLVTLERDSSLSWVGFVSPELYSAPDIAPPYDVSITATDGLGELKEVTFTSIGRASLQDHLLALLEHTGLDINLDDIVIVSSLAVEQPTIVASALLDSLYLDAAHLEGETCYDALVAILGSFGFKITQQGAKWVLLRENDATLAEGAVAAEDASGLPVSLAAPELGSMTETDWWPIGQTSTVVRPARKALSVALPYRLRPSLLENYDLNYDEDSASWPSWTTGSTVYAQRFENGEVLPRLQNDRVYVNSMLQQWVRGVEGGGGERWKLSIESLKNWKWTSLSSERDNEYRFDVIVRFTYNGAQYWLAETGDGATEWVNHLAWLPVRHPVEVNRPEDEDVLKVTRDKFSTQEFELPPLPGKVDISIEIYDGSRDSAVIFQFGTIIGKVAMVPVVAAGYKDAVKINNNARGEGDDIELAFGDVGDVPSAIKTVSNVLTNASGTLTSLWHSARFPEGMQLLRLMAMDAAAAVALPRFAVNGTINVPAGEDVPLFMVSQDGLLSVVEEVEWNLLEDSAEIKMTSISVAEVDLTSEELTQLTQAEAEALESGSAAATPGASAGGVRSVGVEVPEAFEVEGSPITSSGTILIKMKDGYKVPTSEEVAALVLLASWFGADENGDIYVKRKDDDSARNFYAFGGVSSGGKSSGGGGGGSEAVRIDAFDIPQGTTTFTTLDKARGSWTNDKLVCTLYNHLNEVCIADIKINTSGAVKYITVGFSEPILSPMRLVVFADNN